METYVSSARGRLQTWFSKAEDWQKDLFINIWNGGMTEDELLTRTCKLLEQEYLSENHRLAPATKFPSDITFVDNNNGTVRITGISDVKGVGALAPKTPLCFGDGLTVVYGDNGCGKSSYVRILKAMANPVNADAVFGNVFRADNVSAEATVTFSIDGEERHAAWSKLSKKKHPIQIYDTIEADRFVNQKNEIVFEPKVLATISQMVKIYDLAAAVFVDKGRSLEREVGQPPSELRFHPIVKQFAELSIGKSFDEFTQKYTWTDKLQEELSAVMAGLQENNPQKVAKAKEAQREIIRNHGYAILKLLELVSDEAKNEYLIKRERQIATKKAADLLVSTSKDQSLLDEFGCDAWKEMWAQAVEYIRQIEENAELPITRSGRCALCQQELDAKTLERVKAFKTFSEASAMKEAALAFSNFEAVVKSLQDSIENKVRINEVKASLEAGAIPADIQTTILSFYESVLARCTWLLTYCENTKNEIPYIRSQDEITASITERMAQEAEKVKKVIGRRMTKKTVVILSAICLALYLVCFLPFLFANGGTVQTVSTAIVLSLGMCGILAVIMLVSLFFLRSSVTNAVRAYNNMACDLINEIQASMKRFSKYLSASCNVRRGHAVQNYAQKNLDEYTKSLRIRKKHQEDIRKRRAQLVEGYGDYFGDRTFCDETMCRPYDYDFDQKTEYAYPAPFLAGDCRQIEFISNGNLVTVPSSYVKRILVRMEGIYEK